MNDLSGSRGEANFVWRCKNCKVSWFVFVISEVKSIRGQHSYMYWHSLIQQRESSATIKATPVAYEASEPAKKKNVIEIDSRGLEFTEFIADVSVNQLHSVCLWADVKSLLQGEWEAVGTESGTKFTGIDLNDGEWFDYDEKAGEEVSIKDVKFEIRRAWVREL